MDLKEAAAALGLSKSVEVLKRGWRSSQQSMPAEELPFLTPGFVAEACRDVYLPEQVVPGAAAVGRRVAEHDPLRALAWHCHHCLYHATDYRQWDVTKWPTLETALQDDAGMFYLLVLLSGMPNLKSVHESHSVPEDIARDTLIEITDSLDWYRKATGRARSTPGLSPYSLQWLAKHVRGDLYRLGRLQFEFTSHHSPVRVLRHQTSKMVIALSEDGIQYRADGGRPDPDDGRGNGQWTARLVLTDEGVVGYPILPVGRALQREVRLAAAEWRQVLAPGQPVLDIHIPDGGKLAHDLCGASFRSAVEFFGRHFPDRPFAAFTCDSWLLDAQIQELLPPTSNIVSFQREVYLFPIALPSDHLLRDLFGREPVSLVEAPRDTSFRRALLDYLHAGGLLSPTGGGCFLLPEDLNWGAQVYRRQQLPW